MRLSLPRSRPAADRLIDAPPVLLVHGAWSGRWVWRPVQRHLRRLGVRSLAIDLPSQAQVHAVLDDDVAAVQTGLGQLGEPAVVVAHSYGGMPVAACDPAQVTHLVYVSAFVPLAGESALALMEHDPTPSRWSRLLHRTAVGQLLLDMARLRTYARGRRPAVRDRPFILAQPSNRRADSRIPATYVVLGRDLVLSPALQRWMATRADAPTVAIPALHIGVITHARQIAQIIAAVARRHEPAATGEPVGVAQAATP